MTMTPLIMKIFKISAHATEWGPAKVLPSGPSSW